MSFYYRSTVGNRGASSFSSCIPPPLRLSLPDLLSLSQRSRYRRTLLCRVSTVFDLWGPQGHTGQCELQGPLSTEENLSTTPQGFLSRDLEAWGAEDAGGKAMHCQHAFEEAL